MPPIDWGRYLVEHPKPEQVTSTGRTNYHEPNMPHSPPSTILDNPMAWERRTWVDGVPFLSNFRDHIEGDIPTTTTTSKSPPRT